MVHAMNMSFVMLLVQGNTLGSLLTENIITLPTLSNIAFLTGLAPATIPSLASLR